MPVVLTLYSGSNNIAAGDLVWKRWRGNRWTAFATSDEHEQQVDPYVGVAVEDAQNGHVPVAVSGIVEMNNGIDETELGKYGTKKAAPGDDLFSHLTLQASVQNSDRLMLNAFGRKKFLKGSNYHLWQSGYRKIDSYRSVDQANRFNVFAANTNPAPSFGLDPARETKRAGCVGKFLNKGHLGRQRIMLGYAKTRAISARRMALQMRYGPRADTGNISLTADQLLTHIIRGQHKYGQQLEKTTFSSFASAPPAAGLVVSDDTYVIKETTFSSFASAPPAAGLVVSGATPPAVVKKPKQKFKPKPKAKSKAKSKAKRTGAAKLSVRPNVKSARPTVKDTHPL